MQLDDKTLKNIANSNDGLQHVDYSIIVSDTEITSGTEELYEAGVKTDNHACFARLPIKIKKHKKQYIIYYVPSKLNEVDTHRWLVISKINKAIPEYFDVDSVVKNGYAALPLYKHNLSAIFVYLTTIRAVVEFPRLVKLALYLYDKCKLDYYTCVAIAFKRHCHNNLHFYMPPGEGYPNTDDANKVEVKYNLLYALIEVIINLTSRIDGEQDNSFNVGRRIGSAMLSKKAAKFSKHNVIVKELDRQKHFEVISEIYATLME